MVERLRDRHRVRIREVRSHEDPAVAKAYRLLDRTFPREEMVGRQDMADVLRERSSGVLVDTNWHLFVAERDGEVVGVSSGTFLGSLDVGVVGYVVVSAQLRSLGLGPRLRRRLRAAFEADARERGRRRLEAIVGEVAGDNPWLRFLVRQRGAIALDLPYIQPPLRPDDEPTSLVLYWQPLHGRPASLPVETVRQLVYALWRRVYRVPRPLSSRHFRRMLRSLGGRRKVGQRPLETLPEASRRRH